MRIRVPVFIALLLSIASVGISLPAAAAFMIYGGTLTGDTERPTPVVTPATGEALVFFDDVTGLMRVFFTFNDLQSDPRVAHIHCCIVPPAEAVGVATELPSFDGFPLPGAPRSGVYDRTIDLNEPGSLNPAFVGAGTTQAAIARLSAGLAAGRAYLNVHTINFPGGEIRANLRSVPEPALGALWLAGLGAALVMRRRTRGRAS